MKKQLKEVARIVCILFLALGLFNCNIVDSEEPLGSINLKITEEVSRTLLPELSMEVHSYKITGNGPNSETFTETSTKPIITIDKLIFGEWTIAVIALNKDGIEISSGSQSVSVKGKLVADITIVVKPIAGTGSLNLSLNWTGDKLETPKIIASLQPLQGEKLNLDFIIDKATATCNVNNLNNGYFTLIIQLFEGTQVIIGSREVVRIVSNQVTNGVFNYNIINKEITGSVTSNFTVQMSNPLNVSISGGVDTKKLNEAVEMTVSVKDYSDEVSYVWYVDGTQKGTGSTFSFDHSWSVGSYNISVTALSLDGLRAGNETIAIKVVDPNLISVHYLKFDGNGGSGSMFSQAKEEGSIFTIRENSFDKAGSIFLGWNTLPDGTGTWYKDGDTYTMGTFAVTLYAQWEVIKEFITKWGASDVLRIPFAENGSYDFEINWGDGTIEHVTDISKGYLEHIYSDKGKYIVRIWGKCNGFGFNGNEEDYEHGYIIDILKWGSVKLRDGGHQFTGLKYITKEFSATDTLNISNITDMSYMFAGTRFKGDLSKWDTSNVTNMSNMFYGASLFNGDISEWDTSKVTNMSNMFKRAEVFNGNLSKWKTLNVTDMSGMFYGATTFNNDISGWDTSNVTDMSGMFYGATTFNSDISGWDTSNVTNMSEMFRDAYAFNKDLLKWDTSKVTNMSSMFSCEWNKQIAFNGDISKWNTKEVVDMSSMFQNASSFSGDISKWNTSKVTNMSSMFYSADSFSCNLDWDTSKVTNMSNMFRRAEAFNGNLSNWNTSNVTDMSYMFSNATAFNGNISNWNTSNVTDMSVMFGGASRFNGDITNWKTYNVTDMSYMFSGAEKFNSDISGWKTIKVTDMRSMFKKASTFNRDISAWDTSNVEDMSSMFLYAKKFNSDISKWNIENVMSLNSLFKGAESFNCDISGWNTSNIINMESMFEGAAAFNCGGIYQLNWKWDVPKVKFMSDMFLNSKINKSKISWYDESK